MGSKILAILDRDNRGEFFDLGEEYLATPKREDVEFKREEDLLGRLNDMQSPRERVAEFIKSQCYFGSQPQTHEALMVRTMALSGLAFGWLFGGLAKSKGLHESFVREHNAAVFDSKHRAKREYADTFLYRIIKRGAKYGVGSSLLCTSAGLIGFGSIAYRNKLYYPDWLVCFGTVGAVSRCWLGLRGVVAGFGLGMIGGTLGFGLAKFAELLSGKSVTHMRYLNHVEYLKRREARLDRIHKLRERHDKEFTSPWL